VRSLVLLIAALLAACTAQPPAPTPTPITTPAPTATPSAEVTPTPTTPPSQSPSPTPSHSAGPPLADALGTDLAPILDQQLASNEIPGASATIIFPDGSTWSYASGLARLDPAQPATPDTLYSVGSITKTFVTAVIMELAQEGALSLDDPLATWIPDFPNASGITLRELLGHTSGVADFFENPNYNSIVIGDPSHAWTPQEVLDRLVGAPYFAPGAGYHYSNTGFLLLGMVIEKVTGKDLGDVFSERLFGPAGLTNTYFQGSVPPPAGAAVGHSASTGLDISDGTNYRPTLSEATAAWAAGAIASRAPDIAQWGRTLYGGHLLDPASLAQMEDYNYAPDSLQSYGLGTRTRVFGDQRMFGHTGTLRGFYGAMWYYPDSDLTVVVLTNKGKIDPNPIVDALSTVALPAANNYLGR
jgi:D-alanyl-D-alanine carboxypeptidase